MNCRYLYFSILLVLFGFLTLMGTPVIAQTNDTPPILAWDKFFGGSAGYDECRGNAVDGDGNLYAVGYSTATWGSPINPYGGGTSNVFVAKLDSNGDLIWNTFLGYYTTIYEDIAVDGNGNIYVVGSSDSSWGSPIRPFSGNNQKDTFVAKLDGNGNLIWNTFLGGSGYDESRNIAVDGNGNIYVTGHTNASWGSPIRPLTGGFDGFVAKLDGNGNLIWNTFLGGSGEDDCQKIAVDGLGNVYIIGLSESTWGAPLHPHNGGSFNYFLAKLDSTGNLSWNTFGDVGPHILADVNGGIYMGGSSGATWGNPIHQYSGGSDAFVAKLDTNGNLTWNTFLGGVGNDGLYGIAMDQNGDVFVYGRSSASWGSPFFPFTLGSNNGFLSKLDKNGNLVWNTFFIGKGATANAMAMDRKWNVYLTGSAPWLIGSDENPFVAKLLKTFTISGYVRTSGGGGISGVTMNGLPGNPTTDVTGYYTATVESGESGTVSPSKYGYSFNPINRIFSNLSNNQENQDYIGTLLTISGYIRTSGGTSISGVTLNGLPGNPTTDGNGFYTATVDNGWSGTVTPVKAGYSISPPSHPYSNITSIQENQNYTGTIFTYPITGYIRTSGGAGIGGATLNGLPGNLTTDGNGYYTGTVDYGWSGTVSPTKAGYSFSPFHIPYSNLTANQVNQNYTALSSTSTRNLPSYYVPSYPVQVSIEVIADPSKIIYVVEDSPPSGWTVKNISHNGLWDNSSKKVKWGPFFDHKDRSLTYETTPPWGESGTKTFFGEASFDGINVQIGGKATIDFQPTTYHQADTNSDYRLVIDEITAYGAAWKTGQSWPVSPSLIPINYMSNAGSIWKVSEIYHHDPGLTPPWVPSLLALSQPSMGVSVDTGLFGSGTVSRQMQKYYLADVPVQVELSVVPDTGTQAYALEDSPPSDWIICDINEGGGWEPVNKKVKWGPFFDNTSRAFT